MLGDVGRSRLRWPSGYFEWKKVSDGKQPYFISAAEWGAQPPFRMAAPYYLSQPGPAVKPKAWLADPFLENVRFSF
jgi:putative SOS response-associated peptidase YedK